MAPRHAASSSYGSSRSQVELQVTEIMTRPGPGCTEMPAGRASKALPVAACAAASASTGHLLQCTGLAIPEALAMPGLACVQSCRGQAVVTVELALAE